VTVAVLVILVSSVYFAARRDAGWSNIGGEPNVAMAGAGARAHGTFTIG